jgi:hypothetical protein
MTRYTWEQCARICHDPYRHAHEWLPLHDALGITPGDKIPQGGLTCPEAAALGWLKLARRFPQQRFSIPDKRRMSAPKRGANWLG